MMMIRWHFPSLLLTLLVIACVTLLFRLGTWQLSRSQYKRALQTQEQQAQALAPLSAAELAQQSDLTKLRYRTVQFEGKLLPQYTILLDNKIKSGRVGYEVLVPARLTEQQLILVNLGWIPLGRSRAELPQINFNFNLTTIEGYLDFSYRNPLISSSLESNKVQWPLRMQQLDIELLQNLIGTNIYPMLVKLDKAPASHGMSPERHLGYAVQWFALAATLAILFGMVMLRRKARR